MPDTALGAAGISAESVSVSLDGGPVLRAVDFAASPGSQVAVLGPSGCGKTTLLRSLAGLQRIDDGEIRIGDRVVAAHSFHAPPESRGVGLVFQDWALFPHLTVAANVAYGLPIDQRGRFSFGSRRQARAASHVADLLDMVGIGDLADRMPGSLSGGQQQRVALARALAPKPSVLLLDEPFSSLDTNLRADVRADVARLLRHLEITAVFVTHDQDEAFVLGDEVAVMRDGKVVQHASPAQLYAHPVDPWLARFVGDADVLPGEGQGDCASTAIGRVPLQDETLGDIDVLIRPEEVVVEPQGDGEVVAIEYYGHDAVTTVRFTTGVEVRSRTTGAPRFAVGDSVNVHHSGAASVAYVRSADK
jgi:iron(III) transport system ATP-binding protein